MNQLVIYKDAECEMLSMYLNDEPIGFGNYWHFHNGGICRNDDLTYGEFNSSSELIENIKKMFSPINILYKKFSYETLEYYD